MDRTSSGERAARTCKRAYESKWLRLALGFVFCVVTLVLHSNHHLQELLYGKELENEYLWYVTMVPAYSLTFVLTVKFCGSFLLAVWVRELVESDFVVESIVTLLANLMTQDRKMPEVTDAHGHRRTEHLVGHLMEQPTVVAAATFMVASVTSSTDVHAGAASLVAGTMRSDVVFDSVMHAAGAITGNVRLRRQIANLLDDRRLAPAVAEQLHDVLASPTVHEGVVKFVERLVVQEQIREAIKIRTKSVMADPELYRAGGKGMYIDMFGRTDTEDDDEDE